MKSIISHGEKLRLLRVKHNISQATLADAIFVKNTTISNWENDSRQIHLQHLEEICRYFKVPLDYFLESNVTESTAIKKQPNAKSFVALALTSSFVIVSAFFIFSNSNKLQNEACYGELSCYVINDPSIVSELQARSISGGLMTNVEMNLVSAFLTQYQHVLPPAYSNTQLRASYFAHNQSGINYDVNGSFKGGDYLYDYLRTYEVDVWWETFTNLETLNDDVLQVFYVEPFDAKVVVFKTGANSFDYEIWTSTIDVFKIDLNLNKLYLNNVLVEIPSSIPQSTFDTYIGLLEVSRTWVDPNRALFGFLPLGNDAYLYYNFEYKATATYNYKAHRFNLFDVLNNRAYSIDLNTNIDEGNFFSLYQYPDALTDAPMITITSSKVLINATFNFSDIESIFTNPDTYNLEGWSVGGAETTAAFFETNRDRFPFPDLTVDFSATLIHNPF